MKRKGLTIDYHKLFDHMLEGLAYCRMIFDREKKPITFVFLQVNKNYEELTGMKGVVGRKVTDLIPGIKESNPEMFAAYARVALTGVSEEIEIHVAPLGRWFMISVYGVKKGYFVAVFQNITDRKKIENDLVHAKMAARNVLEDLEDEKRKLEKIDRAKSEFVSLASHQLRTPLTTVNWYSEMLLESTIGDNLLKRKEYLEKIHGGSKRMVVLVNTLLNVSRIELGTLTVEPKSTDITKLLEDVITEQKPQIDKKNIIVTNNFPKSLPAFQTDQNLLHMVFQNLLSNAVKYTAPLGRVDITLLLHGSDMVITFSDTGYGIPKKDRDRIFSKMFRADNVKEKGVDGTGLGLYIVKSVLATLGGSIRFESEENKGTKFFVTLPYSLSVNTTRR